MSKFKIDAVKNGIKNAEKKGESIYGNTQNGIKVGAGLLGAVDREKAGIEKMESIDVPYERIKTTPKNEWSINEESIRELADLIKDVGLLNPLILKKLENGDYEIVAGERRYRAIGMLIAEGDWPKDRPVPAHRFDPKLIKLDLTDQEKEDYVRLAENDGQRNKTDGDTYLKMRCYTKLYNSLRAKGELSGIKTRKLLAADMKISESKVEQFQRVENRGSIALQEALLNDDITASTAVEILSFPKEKQDAFIEKAKAEKEPGKKIEKDDIRKFTHEQKQQHGKAETEEKIDSETSMEMKADKSEEIEELSGTLITVEQFRKDIKPILKAAKSKEIRLEEKQYEAYLRCIERLTNLFK